MARCLSGLGGRGENERLNRLVRRDSFTQRYQSYRGFVGCTSVAKQPTPNTEKMMQSPIDSMIDKACGYEPEECRPDPTDLAQQVASNVMHHIHTMYPAMIEAAPKTAQVSVRNTILREVEKALSFYA